MDFGTACIFVGLIIGFPVASLGLEVWYWWKGQSNDPRIGDSY